MLDSGGRPGDEFALNFAHALGEPAWALGFRTHMSDFQVAETLGFTPDGDGEHLLLHLRKTGQNTRWVALQLANFYGVPEYSVGYCGLKDRRAVTSQWFSVQLPGNTAPALPAIEGCEVIDSARHLRKLRPGMHRDNRFTIRLRDGAGHQDAINGRLAAIARSGVPNYFGEQRFGRDAGNLREVAAIVSRPRPRFRGKKGGLYLSAARSWLFNLVLDRRVRDGSWQMVPDGPLWGRGRSAADVDTGATEAEVLAPWRHWCEVLEHSGLSQERRPLVLMPDSFAWSWQDGDLTLSFGLPPGTFATALLREVAGLRVADNPE